MSDEPLKRVLTPKKRIKDGDRAGARSRRALRRRDR
jgi:hypothetical protein